MGEFPLIKNPRRKPLLDREDGGDDDDFDDDFDGFLFVELLPRSFLPVRALVVVLVPPLLAAQPQSSPVGTALGSAEDKSLGFSMNAVMRMNPWMPCYDLCDSMRLKMRPTFG